MLEKFYMTNYQNDCTLLKLYANDKKDMSGIHCFLMTVFMDYGTPYNKCCRKRNYA